MARRFLLDPGGLAAHLETRFRRQRNAWLRGEGDWPLRQGLGMPTEQQALEDVARVAAWVRSWQDWPGPGRVDWVERRWSRLGTQRLPRAVLFEDAAAVAALLGQAGQWRQAEQRLAGVSGRWPALSEVASRHWRVLGEWETSDFQRLLALLDWLLRHPRSGLLVRQLPVPGVDGKWLEGHRRLLREWLGALLGVATEGRDLLDLAGLRRPPNRLRLRVLDPGLRAALGGLGDIEAPVAEVAALDLPIRRAFVVENLQTGLAFEDLPGAVVFMKQGYAVDVFADIPWLNGIPVHYWGDLDTNGFAILDRLRAHLPAARSLLMDEATLLHHRELWGHEARPAGATRLPRLSAGEAALYRDLRDGRWGPGVRLEQERIEWDYAMDRIAALAADADADR